MSRCEPSLRSEASPFDGGFALCRRRDRQSTPAAPLSWSAARCSYPSRSSTVWLAKTADRAAQHQNADRKLVDDRLGDVRQGNRCGGVRGVVQGIVQRVVHRGLAPRPVRSRLRQCTGPTLRKGCSAVLRCVRAQDRVLRRASPLPSSDACKTSFASVSASSAADASADSASGGFGRHSMLARLSKRQDLSIERPAHLERAASWPFMIGVMHRARHSLGRLGRDIWDKSTGSAWHRLGLRCAGPATGPSCRKRFVAMRLFPKQLLARRMLDSVLLGADRGWWRSFRNLGSPLGTLFYVRTLDPHVAPLRPRRLGHVIGQPRAKRSGDLTKRVAIGLAETFFRLFDRRRRPHPTRIGEPLLSGAFSFAPSGVPEDAGASTGWGRDGASATILFGSASAGGASAGASTCLRQTWTLRRAARSSRAGMSADRGLPARLAPAHARPAAASLRSPYRA